VLRHGQWKGEVELISSKGKKIPILGNIFLINNDLGKPQYYAHVLTDLTEIKKSEENTRNNEAALRSIFENMQDIYYRTDKNGCYINISSQIEEIFQYTAEEVIGINSKEFWQNPDDRDVFLDEVRKHEKVKDYEVRLLKKDGTPIVGRLNTTIWYDEDGNMGGTEGIFRDCTELKKYEKEYIEALANKKAAEQANKSKTKFLSSISHELRTPLNAIIGFAQLLGRKVPACVEHQENMEYIENILNSGNHLLELINEILDLTKVEMGNLSIEMSNLHVVDIIEECISMLASTARKKNVSIKLKGQKGQNNKNDKKLFIRGDYTRFKQILINIVSNAIKYNKPDGSVEIELVEFRNRQLGIKIIDTGIGIPKNEIKDIFKPFSRVANNIFIEGTGIGLTITKQLVELMNGTISVDSEFKKGSAFTVMFPLVSLNDSISDNINENLTPQDKQDKKDDLSTGDIDHLNIDETKKHSVLYIEDHPTNQKLVKTILIKDNKYEYISAGTGQEGITKAIDCSPSLILLDINLPDIHGFEVLETIKQNHKTSSIPVIALTADAMPSDIERGLKAGFNDYIIKPFKIDELLSKIDDLVIN